MTNEQTTALRDQAQLLLDNITADIRNASTRIEHMRLTQLASEAERLVTAIDILSQP